MRGTGKTQCRPSKGYVYESTASYLELLLESKSFNDLLNRVEMIVQMVTYDQQVFDSLQMYRDEVEQRKQDCEEQEQRILEQKLSIEKKNQNWKKKNGRYK